MHDPAIIVEGPAIEGRKKKERKKRKNSKKNPLVLLFSVPYTLPTLFPMMALEARQKSLLDQHTLRRVRRLLSTTTTTTTYLSSSRRRNTSEK